MRPLGGRTEGVRTIMSRQIQAIELGSPSIYASLYIERRSGRDNQKAV